VQGILADCWLIAALASIAWTRPEIIAERIRRDNPIGDVEAANDKDSGHAKFRFDFTDVLTIPLPFPFGAITIPFTFPIWIGEEVPQHAGGSPIYAKSSVATELWPAVIEKAVAVWISGGDPDFPSSEDYGHLNGGDAGHVIS
jgi:hypothetical protein